MTNTTTVKKVAAPKRAKNIKINSKVIPLENIQEILSEQPVKKVRGRKLGSKGISSFANVSLETLNNLLKSNAQVCVSRKFIDALQLPSTPIQSAANEVVQNETLMPAITTFEDETGPDDPVGPSNGVLEMTEIK